MIEEINSYKKNKTKRLNYCEQEFNQQYKNESINILKQKHQKDEYYMIKHSIETKNTIKEGIFCPNIQGKAYYKKFDLPLVSDMNQQIHKQLNLNNQMKYAILINQSGFIEKIKEFQKDEQLDVSDLIVKFQQQVINNSNNPSYGNSLF
ncbi:hypothetical protein PPERSA_05905 [Pseudocohnilembus persalinus]|uniref:Uncharacterized protein n=1 Tax=Pseudocohnilembus persalinus TaxID=266149 RepID=A0A0V0R431_PSEPJ|nr:hypothetical protein PPERSA_05905 [Pseudocohnilembus persalinus]|eukprot:KRX09236.1 hypothetical protein PPERSA_05905 [Pseudocohnilembus persalinus]